MVTRRSTFGELVAAISGIAAVVALFFEWYGQEIGPVEASASGWESLTVIDVVIAVVGVLAVLHWVARGSGWLERPLPVEPAVVVALLGAVVVVLVIVRLIDPPAAVDAAGLDGRRVGIFMALAAGAGILLGALAARAERRPSGGAAKPAVVDDRRPGPAQP